MDTTEAKEILSKINHTIALKKWEKELIMAVQLGLAKLYLLNPHDDIDGLIGRRTQDAWKFFKEATSKPNNTDVIETESANLLIRSIDNRDEFIGKTNITLQPDFEFRRKQSKSNKDKSVESIINTAKNQQLINAQIAYILATAEHESDSFNTLEEYADGTKYENRSDLGNNEDGDGVRFKGRGYAQLTGRRNYTKYADITGIKLVEFPIILMNWAALSAYIIVHGMINGIYTTHKLEKFVNDKEQNFIKARRVVNGDDCAEKIAAQAEEWLKKLNS